MLFANRHPAWGHSGTVIAALGAVMLFQLFQTASAAGEPLSHEPVPWYEQDRRAIRAPKARDPNSTWDMIDNVVFLPLRRATTPGRMIRRVGTLFRDAPVGPAANLNALDEAINSSWFTNRIGLFPMGPDEAAAGSGAGLGPDRNGPWTVVGVETDGDAPRILIRDARGTSYVLKFDPRGFLGMTTRACVISSRILYAAGYNVADDNVVTFRREDLVLDNSVRLRPAEGSSRVMTTGDWETILNALDYLPDGQLLAVASEVAEGDPIGPFDYNGKRRGDRNDQIAHQHRRELRGLRVFAAWLNYFDASQQNTFDAYVRADEKGSVVHYLSDFTSTLGATVNGSGPRYGYEYTFSPAVTLRRMLSLGLYEDPWRRITRPSGLEEIGYLESVEFAPLSFRPLQPNSAFVNLTDRDGYWAAKIVSAFTNEHLDAICRQAHYQNPEAGAHAARVLAERRDKIARVFFDRVPPLDFFTLRDGILVFHDLGVERGIYPAGATRYWAGITTVNANREPGLHASRIEFRESRLSLREVFAMPITIASPGERFPFLAIECRVDRGWGWSRPVTVYFSRLSGRAVALER